MTAQSGLSARSGEIGDSAEYGEYKTSWIETSVSGAGTLTFVWKVECEFDDSGDASWDHIVCIADGREVFRMDGASGWETKEIEFANAGTHVVRWMFVKDDYNEDAFADCAWLSDVVWTPNGDAGVMVDAGDGKTVTVSQTWLAEKTTRAATDVAANGRKVWECYVLGLDPEDAESEFKITAFPMKADGSPDLEKMTVSPAQSQWNVEGAHPVIKGKASLNGAGEWQTVTDENKAQMRFFRVEVQLP